MFVEIEGNFRRIRPADDVDSVRAGRLQRRQDEVSTCLDGAVKWLQTIERVSRSSDLVLEAESVPADRERDRGRSPRGEASSRAGGVVQQEPVVVRVEATSFSGA